MSGPVIVGVSAFAALVILLIGGLIYIAHEQEPNGAEEWWRRR